MQTQTSEAGAINRPGYLSVEAASAYLGLSKSTLDKMRVYGSGPVFIRAGKRVIYAPADLDAWALARRVASTSQTVRA